MTADLPAVLIAVPLLGAPLCVLVRARSAAWVVLLLSTLGAALCAVLLAVEVRREGPVSYAVGGWQPPEGIEFVVDDFNVPLLLLVSGMAVATAVYARHTILRDIDPRRAPLMCAFLCLVVGGLLGLTVTGDAFNAFVFLEISSLSTYALIALGRHRRALLASFRYLVIGSVGALFFLLGIGLAYAVTGTLNMADLADRLADDPGNRATVAAVVFVFVGLAIKFALFPLHGWLPTAYAEAPPAVVTFVAAVSTKVALYVLARFAFTIFGVDLVFERLPMGTVGLLLGSVAMLAGSLYACFQQDLRYVLAWSSVAQIGYVVVGLSLATAAGVSAAFLHILVHAVTKGALFAAAGVLAFSLGSVTLRSLGGLGRTMPWTFAAVILAGLGLVGLPPTAGFASKVALTRALIDSDQWVVLAAMLTSSVLALVYVGRVVEAAWFRDPPERSGEALARPPAGMVAVTWVLVAATLYVGLHPDGPATLADAAAAALLGGGGE